MKLLASLLAVCLLFSISQRSFAQQSPESINLRRTTVVEVVGRTKDAVVNISAEKLVSQRVSPFGPNLFWEGMPYQTITRKATSLGSGFIVHENGYVVTNNHVIDRASEITVELSDGRKLPATLISADAEADLAILKISDPKPLPVLDLGDSSDLMIGEPVIAVGNPFGYSHSVSTGIVSAVHRDLTSQNGKPWLGNLIQTDAAINPGNSGGPLLNAYGQVIGINSAIRSDAQNIGFAIAVNSLRDLIPELMDPARANKIDVALKLTETRTLTPPDHVACQVVSAQNPDHALRSINGRHPRDIIDAYAMLLNAKVGQRLVIDWSTGTNQTLTPTAVPLPDPLAIAREKLGLTFLPVSPELAKKYDLGVSYGLMVKAVAHNSIGSRAEIQPGDVVVQLGKYRIATLDDLSALIQLLPTRGRVYIGIMRSNEFGYALLEFDN